MTPTPQPFKPGTHVETRIVLAPSAKGCIVHAYRGGVKVESAWCGLREDGRLLIELVVDPAAMTDVHHCDVAIELDPSMAKHIGGIGAPASGESGGGR